jgi:hypothetical protein
MPLRNESDSTGMRTLLVLLQTFNPRSVKLITVVTCFLHEDLFEICSQYMAITVAKIEPQLGRMSLPNLDLNIWASFLLFLNKVFW